MTPDLLADCGRHLFGRGWQRALARALGPMHPKGARDAINDRLVRRWVAGDRQIPAWVTPAIVKALNKEADDCKKLLKKIAASEAPLTPNVSHEL